MLGGGGKKKSEINKGLNSLEANPKPIGVYSTRPLLPKFFSLSHNVIKARENPKRLHEEETNTKLLISKVVAFSKLLHQESFCLLMISYLNINTFVNFTQL